ncbi:1-(5-phosphoribosyl)-5-[(5-phosphoribosylamino)methylideneamino]imidazole-4-carboxamide isomerase [Candidatus Formimonas warabiya]|uniref:1-(5-phosphoribosyl)-5-[(5-phosphoribosylamino)methylideneamino] imidazole-4-carboxamide isomerase n=1 Tax=Formimonas warabiya TaxID=1761012 RepID=A0A3G1KLW1_FORW1|nr:1-(5-phosphoribosyl)-5-[(5-phosphoribosylamino)methylideneamino]imidazole-4-carboxamide isomerase [Candidatus Formimonas warabiya]ATW23407.1 1-(5-phosphoribosyl)-5-[(5-phosphoribosylamino)methylideneamino]imidazole-4-carboxamide isomerase [Candidatus Formimonas warabiya]
MMMIPAIDIRSGKCVRLVEGKRHRETIYADDPVGVAKAWEEAGAEMIHLVDLDGAFAGSPQNLPVVEAVIKGIRIPVQLGGGIRKMATMEKVLALGVNRVILGTAAVSHTALVAAACARFGERIVVGIDSKKGLVSIEGWEATVPKTDVELGREMKKLGLARVVYTDTCRDGTLQGPNIEAAVRLAKESGLKVIVSGGVSSLEDLKKIKQMEHHGLEGVIMGKALYEGAVDLRDAIKLDRGELKPC